MLALDLIDKIFGEWSVPGVTQLQVSLKEGCDPVTANIETTEVFPLGKACCQTPGTLLNGHYVRSSRPTGDHYAVTEFRLSVVVVAEQSINTGQDPRRSVH